MKCSYIPKGGKSWKFYLKMEIDRIVDRQTEEFVVAGRRGLDCKYNQEEDKYKHPNATLIHWNEETKRLQEICTINSIEENQAEEEIKVSIELDILDLISCEDLEEQVWSLEDWMMENKACMNLINSMDNDFIGLCKEVDILRKKIEKQKLHVQTLKVRRNYKF